MKNQTNEIDAEINENLFHNKLGDLLYYGGVEWLNISDFLGKIKKGLELHAMCFVFKSAVVFLCKERLRQKKKLMVSVDQVSGQSIYVTLTLLTI